MAKTASSNREVIIACAVAGSIHTPSMSPHLPVTAEEIAGAAIGAYPEYVMMMKRATTTARSTA